MHFVGRHSTSAGRNQRFDIEHARNRTNCAVAIIAADDNR